MGSIFKIFNATVKSMNFNLHIIDGLWVEFNFPVKLINSPWNLICDISRIFVPLLPLHIVQISFFLLFFSFKNITSIVASIEGKFYFSKLIFASNFNVSPALEPRIIMLWSQSTGLWALILHMVPLVLALIRLLFVNLLGHHKALIQIFLNLIHLHWQEISVCKLLTLC